MNAKPIATVRVSPVFIDSLGYDDFGKKWGVGASVFYVGAYGPLKLDTYIKAPDMCAVRTKLRQKYGARFCLNFS
jgi:hypothetical protein